MRVALYARYSSERQNERSIEDQLVGGRRHAAARGWEVVAQFSDAAISGAAMANRPGLQSLLAAAQARTFDLVLIEDEDRLARNLEHQAHIFNRLKHAGVGIATLASDRIGVLEVGLKGVMAELYLTNLSLKTSRGMRANAEQGLATGARIYGYRSQPGGAMAIVEAEADIVREIYRRFAAGESARQIAAELNRRRVPSPKGGTWAANMINGSRQRANGILYSELYAGVKIWNRLEISKDPDTGRRTSRPRPRDEWRRTPVPHLRIITDDAWSAAQARKAAERGLSAGQVSARRKAVFSGLLKCGCCGASYTSYSKTRLVCAAAREKGPDVCTNWAKPLRAMVERRILSGLQTRLATPEAAAIYMEAYRAAWTEVAGRRLQERRPVERRLAELGRRIERCLDEVEEGHGARVRDRLARLEAEEVDLKAMLAKWQDDDGDVVELHPNAPAAYARSIADLHARLPADANSPESRELVDVVRSLVIRVDITPDAAAEDGYRIAVVGDLARFLEPLGEPGGCMVVAGGRFSPPPPRIIPVTIAA